MSDTNLIWMAVAWAVNGLAWWLVRRTTDAPTGWFIAASVAGAFGCVVSVFAR